MWNRVGGEPGVAPCLQIQAWDPGQTSARPLPTESLFVGWAVCPPSPGPLRLSQLLLSPGLPHVGAAQHSVGETDGITRALPGLSIVSSPSFTIPCEGDTAPILKERRLRPGAK